MLSVTLFWLYCSGRRVQCYDASCIPLNKLQSKFETAAKQLKLVDFIDGRADCRKMRPIGDCKRYSLLLTVNRLYRWLNFLMIKTNFKLGILKYCSQNIIFFLTIWYVMLHISNKFVLNHSVYISIF